MLTENNPDAIINVVFATSNNIPADGTSTASVTAQVTDSAGAGLSGQSVVFTATAGAIIGSPVITDTSGLATTTLTSTTAGISSVTASVNGSAGHVDITFTEAALSPVISSLISDKDSIVNDGNDKAILTVIVSDNRTGNPVAGENITWTTSAGTIEPGTSLSNTDGLAIAALADTGDTGTAIVTASLDNGEEATCDISLVNSDAGWIISSLTSDKDSIVNNGTDTATLTATVIDSATGSIVSGAAVSWSTDSGTVSPATSATDENGLVTTQLSDTGDIGKATITASLDNGKQATQVVSVQKEIMLVIRGGRRRIGYNRDWQSAIVALDQQTGLPVDVIWKYQGDETSSITSRFFDPSPAQELHVTSGAETIILAPVNIAGNTYYDSAHDLFSARELQGNVVAWGYTPYGGSVPDEIASHSDLQSLASTHGSMAALTISGGVVAWGYTPYGGSVPDEIASRNDLNALAGSNDAFAALTKSGGVVTWGDTSNGGSVPTEIATRTDLITLSATQSAFAALTKSGGVVTWGNTSNGGNVPTAIATRNDIEALYSSSVSFAALTATGGVVTWGSGGDVPVEIATRSDLVTLCGTDSAFAALTLSGGVVAWGNSSNGGNVPAEIETRTDLVALAATSAAFAALTKTGGVITWGSSSAGGAVPVEIATRNDLITLTGNGTAFAALTKSGNVVTWGNRTNGGTIPEDREPLLTDIMAVYSNPTAFIALKADNTVIVWGAGTSSQTEKIPTSLQSNISYYQK